MRVANTGLAVHRTTIQCTLNNKDLVAKNNDLLPEMNFLATIKKGMLEKKGRSLCRGTPCQLWSLEVDPLRYGVVWQLGAQKILCKWKEEWGKIPKLQLQEAFASCYSCPKNYKWLTYRIPKLLHRAFFFFFFFWKVILLSNFKKCVLLLTSRLFFLNLECPHFCTL